MHSYFISMINACTYLHHVIHAKVETDSTILHRSLNDSKFLDKSFICSASSRLFSKALVEMSSIVLDVLTANLWKEGLKQNLDSHDYAIYLTTTKHLILFSFFTWIDNDLKLQPQDCNNDPLPTVVRAISTKLLVSFSSIYKTINYNNIMPTL